MSGFASIKSTKRMFQGLKPLAIEKIINHQRLFYA